jgi:hypothetical protein
MDKTATSKLGEMQLPGLLALMGGIKIWKWYLGVLTAQTTPFFCNLYSPNTIIKCARKKVKFFKS